MTPTSTPRLALRLPLALGIAAIALGTPLALSGCDKDVNSSKSTKTTTTTTPDGTKKTTETTEKKVETEHKNP